MDAIFMYSFTSTWLCSLLINILLHVTSASLKHLTVKTLYIQLHKQHNKTRISRAVKVRRPFGATVWAKGFWRNADRSFGEMQIMSMWAYCSGHNMWTLQSSSACEECYSPPETWQGRRNDLQQSRRVQSVLRIWSTRAHFKECSHVKAQTRGSVA